MEVLPEKYKIQVVGVQDPDESSYYVLDMVHDRHARRLLRRLVRDYRAFTLSSRADALEAALDETQDRHFSHLEKKWPKPKTSTRKQGPQ
jgi:hypothetical protein